MKYHFVVHYWYRDIGLEAIFRFTVSADTEQQAYTVAKYYEEQLRRDNPWFKEAASTMMRAE